MHNRLCPKYLAFFLSASIFLSGCGATPTPVTPIVQNPAETPTPCVEISVSNETPKVGETIEVVGTAPGALNPNYFGLEIKDEDADDSSMMVNLLAASPVGADVSNILKMVSNQYSDGKAVIVLEAAKAGMTKLDYFASAENFCGVSLGSGSSPKITITVNP